MRGQADAPFRQVEAELIAHRPAEPWISGRCGRPDAFYQAAKNDAVAMRQPGFQQAVDAQLRVATERLADDAVVERRLEHLGIVVHRHRNAARLGFSVGDLAEQIVEGLRERLALRALEQGHGADIVRRQRQQHLAMSPRQLGEIQRTWRRSAFERRQCRLQCGDQRSDRVKLRFREIGARFGRMQRRVFAGVQLGQFVAEA